MSGQNKTINKETYEKAFEDLVLFLLEQYRKKKQKELTEPELTSNEQYYKEYIINNGGFKNEQN